MTPAVRTCPACAGDGRSDDGDQCPRCDGEGFIDQEATR